MLAAFPMYLKNLIFFALVICSLHCIAHPMPHSVMLLDVRQDGIKAQLSLPLKEFQLVFPKEDLDSGYLTLIQRKGKWLDNYLLQHLSITDSAGSQWRIAVLQKSVSEDEQELTGKYHELTYQLWLQPPAGTSPRHFVMHYDAIMHQLITHKLFIKLSKDWYGGLTAKDSPKADIGVLSVNFTNNRVPPVIVNLDEGSAWKGLMTMVNLGIEHIGEGTDHLLFLLVLLLPATLIAENKKWTLFGGTNYSVVRLVKIATAFTIGHSVSLLLGAMQWLALPQQPVEVAIAITILITAIHAIRPLFYGKETYIAVGFGLIHGLAFSGVLAEMDLDGTRMALSILGFNIGIELMQLFVIICTVPWLIILSKSKSYHILRITGAACAILASLAWMAERITNHTNVVSQAMEQVFEQGKWLVLGIACLAMISLLSSKFTNRQSVS